MKAVTSLRSIVKPTRGEALYLDRNTLRQGDLVAGAGNSFKHRSWDFSQHGLWIALKLDIPVDINRNCVVAPASSRTGLEDKLLVEKFLHLFQGHIDTGNSG